MPRRTGLPVPVSTVKPPSRSSRSRRTAGWRPAITPTTPPAAGACDAAVQERRAVASDGADRARNRTDLRARVRAAAASTISRATDRRSASPGRPAVAGGQRRVGPRSSRRHTGASPDGAGHARFATRAVGGHALGPVQRRALPARSARPSSTAPAVRGSVVEQAVASMKATTSVVAAVQRPSRRAGCLWRRRRRLRGVRRPRPNRRSSRCPPRSAGGRPASAGPTGWPWPRRAPEHDVDQPAVTADPLHGRRCGGGRLAASGAAGRGVVPGVVPSAPGLHRHPSPSAARVDAARCRAGSSARRQRRRTAGRNRSTTSHRRRPDRTRRWRGSCQ